MPSSERNSSTWDLNPRTTLPRLLAANAQALPTGVALREKDRGIWQETTWQQAHERTLRCAAGLQARRRRGVGGVWKECVRVWEVGGVAEEEPCLQAGHDVA